MEGDRVGTFSGDRISARPNEFVLFQIERRQFVIPMARPLCVFIPQAQVQSQTLRQLPVVLKVGVVAVASHKRGGVTDVAIRLVRQSQQKGGQRLPSAVHVLRIRRWILRERENSTKETVVHVPPMLDVHTHLQEVLPLNAAQTRNGLVGVVWKRKSTLVHRKQARHVQLRIQRYRLALYRDALNPGAREKLRNTRRALPARYRLREDCFGGNPA